MLNRAFSLFALSVFLFPLFTFLSPATPAYALVIPGVSRDTLKVRNPARKKIRVNVTDPGVSSSWKLRNDQRKFDLTLLGNAFFNYRRAHKDVNVAPLNHENREICRTGAKSCAGMVDIAALLKDYIDPLPVDPSLTAEGNGTGYFVYENWKGKVYMSAPKAEEGWSIRLQR